MQRIVWLFIVILGLASFLLATSPTKAAQKHGRACNSACVTKVNNVATCDLACTDRSGHCVLIDDEGAVTRSENRQACKGRSNIPAKTASAPTETEEQRERDLRDQELYKQAP